MHLPKIKTRMLAEISDVDFYNTAITVQNPLSRFINQQVSVFGNEITNYRIGIHGNNIPTMGVGFDHGTGSVVGNTIR